MKLSTRVVDLTAIRTDGGTQVRTHLDPEWVAELAAMYEEDHDIPPVLLVLDAAEVHWLARGFHRFEAQRRLGRTSVKAVVRDGPVATLDMAKMLAAETGKDGGARCRSRTGGERSSWPSPPRRVGP